mmetsp:Transcript_40151/g.48655  ORF Transcript_40151/g.48655 Transcript_40151/m.48655 type:complete len:239 (-) Transcript_40151:51-767(-)
MKARSAPWSRRRPLTIAWVFKVLSPRPKGSTLQRRSYSSMFSFHKSAPNFLSYSALSAHPSAWKTSALNPYSFSFCAKNSMVSGKRWKVSTNIILHLPLVNSPALFKSSRMTTSPAIRAQGKVTCSKFSQAVLRDWMACASKWLRRSATAALFHSLFISSDTSAVTFTVRREAVKAVLYFLTALRLAIWLRLANAGLAAAVFFAGKLHIARGATVLLSFAATTRIAIWDDAIAAIIAD